MSAKGGRDRILPGLLRVERVRHVLPDARSVYCTTYDWSGSTSTLYDPSAAVVAVKGRASVSPVSTSATPPAGWPVSSVIRPTTVPAAATTVRLTVVWRAVTR
jgi:hypothetical protein